MKDGGQRGGKTVGGGIVLQTAGLAIAYVVAAAAGLQLAFVHGTVSPVWPAGGFAIGALTLWGLRQWPAVAAGALITNFFFAHDPLAVSAGIAIGNTLEACLGALVLRRFNITGEVHSVRDGLAMVGVALVAPAPSAIAGIASLAIGKLMPWDQVSAAGTVWWVGNSMGELIALPLMLAWFGRTASQSHVARPMEFAAVLLATAGLIGLLFLRPDVLARIGLAMPPVGAVLFPPMLWAVLRFRPREALAVLAVGSTVAILLTASRAGYMVIGPLLGLQTMLFAVCGGTIVMLGAITDRIQTHLALSRRPWIAPSESSFGSAFRGSVVKV